MTDVISILHEYLRDDRARLAEWSKEIRDLSYFTVLQEIINHSPCKKTAKYIRFGLFNSLHSLYKYLLSLSSVGANLVHGTRSISPAPHVPSARLCSAGMAAQPTTPPPLQVLTAKEKKYDRQLRLWAASGQQALEDARVLLLNSGSAVAAVETLKNLILPGIGNFTIVDPEIVKEHDLGVNFFLTEESLGKSRAQETCNYLRELNPDVNGQAVQEVLLKIFSGSELD